MNADVPSFQPRRRYNASRTRRLENRVMSVLVGAGFVPHSYLLTTKGRKTGRARRNPVVLVEYDGRRWLVAPYGPVSWVHKRARHGSR
jgi:F420H(2)-dependent quinone reductase